MIEISEETAKVCMQALGELPLKVCLKAFTELHNKLLPASDVEPAKSE